jgi:hypothetical protein
MSSDFQRIFLPKNKNTAFNKIIRFINPWRFTINHKGPTIEGKTMPQTSFGINESNPSPVISLSIFADRPVEGGVITPDSQLLVVVRNKETNITHPNVISVPTQRIPLNLFKAIIDTAAKEKEEDSLTYYQYSFSDSSLANGHDPIIYAVESILSRKLGLSEALEKNEFTFTSCLRVKKVGKSYHPNLSIDQGQIEFIQMLNLVVFIKNGQELIPEKTSSYSHILWTGAKSFLSTVREANPLLLDDDLDPLDYCIHGLCISSTYSVIANEFGIDPNLKYFI